MTPNFVYENFDDDDINKHLGFLPPEDLKQIFIDTKPSLKESTKEAVKDGVVKYYDYG